MTKKYGLNNHAYSDEKNELPRVDKQTEGDYGYRENSKNLDKENKLVDVTSAHVDDAEEDDDDVDISCGIWNFRTNVFGRYFSNLYVFSVCVGIAALFSTMVDRIIPVQLKSLEKQFNIDNAKAGLLTTCSKIGLMSTILFAGHFTRKSNIPVIIGVSGVVQGFILMMPAVLQYTNPYQLEILTSNNESNHNDSSSKYTCNGGLTGTAGHGNSNASDGASSEEINDVAFIVVLAMQVLKGVTDTFHSFFLPPVYMDDNAVDKTKMSIYMGIRQLFSNLAQPLGTEINGILTEIPVDLKETQMNPKDSRFVAAWWLAFLIFGVGTVIASFPLILFPKQLISKKKQQRALDKATVTFAGGHVNEQEEEQEAEKPIIVITSEDNDFLSPAKRRFSLQSSRKNSNASNSHPSSRRASLFPPLEGPTERKVSLTGDIVFAQTKRRRNEPQTNETRGKQESSMMELLKDFPRAVLRLLRSPVYVLILVDIAIISIPMNGMSMFRNVYMANEYNIPMSQVSYASGISTAVGHITGTVASSWLASRVHSKFGYLYIMLASYLVQTGLNPLYIIFGCGNEQVFGATGEYGVPINDTDSCNCTAAKQLISCGSDGMNYLSPCFAGCTGVDGKLFTECSRLMNTTSPAIVTPGLCNTDCFNNFLLYTGLHGVQYFVEGASMVPRNLLILRLVDPRDRAFAISFFMFFMNVISIPSPNIFGSIIDDTCLIWDKDFCQLYDRDKIRYLLSGVDVGINLMVILTLCLNILLFRWENKKLREKQEAEKLANEQKTELENDEKEVHHKF
ncbi:unnamed protein product [Lymnaea stagnalis]|uniref:Solute carrier organic anion transporter family member n=1 Tax=Lymnaea stagnalis TaxID=6523 RepID=A0AAV2I984_LYMST